MNKVKYFIVAALSAATFCGCVLDEVGFGPEADPGTVHKVLISGEIDQQPASKVALDEGFCEGDQVGVYLVNYDGETPGALKVKGNQADNVKFSLDENGEWVPAYDIYYKDNDTKVDAYGYYPYAEPSSVDAYPFEVYRDQSKEAVNGEMGAYEASDFLWAKKSGVKPTSSKVLLTFSHRMSSARVRFQQGSGWDDEAEYAAVKKEVLVTGTVRKATIDLSTGTVTPEGEAPLTGIVPMNDNGDFRAIVVPQNVPAGDVLLTLTIGGQPRHYVRDVETEYLPGKITTYDLTINKKPVTGEFEVEFKGVSVTAWEADNISHGDDAREYAVIHNEAPNRLKRTIEDRLAMDPTKIRNVKLTGKLGLDDYDYIRNGLTSLQRLNMKEVESFIDGVYQIPGSAFEGKRSLIKCILPDKLERIESNAFYGSGLAGSLVLPEGLKYVTGFKGTGITKVYIPSTLEVIGANAFQGCENLMCELYLPESLVAIEDGAFSGSAIQGPLVLPSSLEEIGYGAFNACSALTGSLKIPEKITHVARETFYGTGFTGTLTLPENLQEIEAYAFASVPFKGELYIPKSVSSIGNYAFSYTEFNGKLVFPSDLLYLGKGAFRGCWRLSEVVEFPENIITVPAEVFADCGNILGVQLHKRIEAVSDGAFRNCFYISSFICDAKVPPVVSRSAFDGVAKDNFVVQVPENSLNNYKTASVWSEFKRIEAHVDFSISRRLFRTLNARHSKQFLLRVPVGEAWSIESKPDWVEVSPAKGVGKSEITVTVKKLESGSAPRTGEITFLMDSKSYSTSMTVEQYDYQYGDEDVIQLQKASRGDGVNIVFMGDCFDAKDISEGKYLEAMNEAYGYFFDIEPYLTYKDYFNVYCVFGMSADNGMATVNMIRESRFGSQYTLDAGVSPDFDSVFDAACLAPVNDDMSRTLVVLIENDYDYDGLCYLWGDGSAVAVVPMSTDPAPYDFRGIVHHEAGGHGFGKLADEYIYYNMFIQACPFDCTVKSVERMKSYGFYGNISLSGSYKEVPWAHMIFDPQYANFVDVFEGAYMHSRGVFRSEMVSCMNDNRPYYNAISREEMVKRIKLYAGEEYFFDDFKANDRLALPSVATKSDWTYDGGGASSHIQRPPVFMGEKPTFKKGNR